MMWRPDMFDLSELRGEVDHSFFDSDCDSRGEHKEKKVEQDCEAEEQIQEASLSLHASISETPAGDLSQRTESGEHVSQIKSPTKSRRTKSSRKGRNRVSSASTAPRRWKGNSRESSSDSGHESNLNDKRYQEALPALRGNVKESNDKDVNGQMCNDNEGDGIAFNLSSKKKKNVKSLERYLSHSSTDTDADLESCSSRRSSLESPTAPKNMDTSPSPGLRRNKEEVLGPERLRSTSSDEADESDYSVTDVSPLSSHDSSESLNLNQSKAELIDNEENQEESMPSSGLGNIQHDGSFEQDVDECSILSLESEFQNKVLIHYPGRRSRKNYSFTNDEVQRIDRENQRLLRELSRPSPGPRADTALRRTKTWAAHSPLVRSHSAINRQRELQRIETENLAFLKRLESVKPTPGLKRSEQLADYQRHMAYRGAPSYQICRPALNKGRTSRNTSTAGPRSFSSRAALTTDCDSTPLPRKNNRSSPRPAWC